MDWIARLVNLFLHLDKHLVTVVGQYGLWTYLILFVVIFCETGLVVTPFLPGDSLLFAAGAIAAGADLNVHWLFLLLAAAAIIGDTVNYWLGAWVGPRAFTGEMRFLRKEYLDRTHRFYERHGFRLVSPAEKDRLLRKYWSIPERQVDTSVVLADEKWQRQAGESKAA